jgi:HD-GYP domain-containing protein (c-di-GMP phosphodiesterase class II)
VVRARRGTQFDPGLVDRFCRDATEVLGGLEAADNWETLIAAEPRLGRVVSGAELDAALEALGDFADLKSPFTLGHSRGVAELVTEAGRRLRLPIENSVLLRRAALVHHIGNIGIPSSILDSPRPLSEVERERVRTHPYLAERALSHAPALAGIGALAGLHHERLDGSGYPRGLTGQAIPIEARVLAAADVYHELTEPRPQRPAHAVAEAARRLRAEVRAGRLDGDASAHLEHIYTKLGVSSRTEAALFAMRHGLLSNRTEF